MKLSDQSLLRQQGYIGAEWVDADNGATFKVYLPRDRGTVRPTSSSGEHLSPAQGDAQILVVPDLEAGNMLAKNLTFLANAEAAGIVVGARVPIVLTSRADSVRSRMASCAIAALCARSRPSIPA